MIFHAFLTTLFLFSFHFLPLLLNAPLVAYNVNKIMTKQHMYDATEIFRTLGKHKNECFFKLGCVTVDFFTENTTYLLMYHILLSSCPQLLLGLLLLLSLPNDSGTRSGRLERRRLFVWNAIVCSTFRQAARAPLSSQDLPRRSACHSYRCMC